MKFTKIPADAFESLQTNAGVLLKNFDPATAAEPVDTDIISATKGGVTASCVPTFSDMAEDVDNAPKNMMEFKKLDGWECKLSATLLGATKDTIKMMLGAADVSAEGKITPRADLKKTDFTDLWWVGDRADGGMYAINLKNALGTSGFSLKTTDKGKGEFAFEATGHVSLAAQSEVPMEFYVGEPATEAVTEMAMKSTAKTSAKTDNLMGEGL